MIPTIEEIISGLIAGKYSAEQAKGWMQTHLSLAAPRGFEYPDEGRVQGDDFAWDFPILHFGHGAIECGDATWEGVPSLFIGRKGMGLGVERDRNEPAESGETLVLFTFKNVEGLQALESAIARVRAKLTA